MIVIDALLIPSPDFSRVFFPRPKPPTFHPSSPTASGRQAGSHRCRKFSQTDRYGEARAWRAPMDRSFVFLVASIFVFSNQPRLRTHAGLLKSTVHRHVSFSLGCPPCNECSLARRAPRQQTDRLAPTTVTVQLVSSFALSKIKIPQSLSRTQVPGLAGLVRLPRE
jgi:hypothetical protein